MVEGLAGLAIALQTIEHLQILQATRQIWDWQLLRQEYPRGLRWLLDRCLDFPHFRVLLWLRLCAALSLLLHPQFPVVAFLLLTTVLIALRFRGTFNGGSDTMTVVVLSALLWPRWGITYLAVQVCLSYFVAGLVKIRRPDWRNGQALQTFLQNQGRRQLPGPLARPASWLVMLWECAFPLACLNGTLCLGFCALGVIFHLANFWFFGLNRFVFIWLACYPALYETSRSGVLDILF